LKIVHISDIHCGPEFLRSVFERAAGEINDIQPDVLVVSGDLTENGLLSQFRLAREMIDLIECDRKLFCSGNHDYRSTGYLLFKKFFPSKPIVRLGNCVFATVSTARPERNEGEVGHRQVVWLEHTLARYRNVTKIVIIHHHLIQVPDTGPDNIPVIDAGDTLRGILEADVNLVLSGHRHRPWRWVLQDTQIIHAGTLSSERFRGFYASSYNILNLDGKRVDAKLKIVGGKSMSFEEVTKGRVRFPHGLPYNQPAEW
jgi:3',5'-cyclic AMP phosphodiesterase CpdA